MTVSTESYTQLTPSTPSIDRILALNGVRPVEVVYQGGSYYFRMTVPTGERLVLISDAFKYYMLDREQCYQDLTMMVEMTEIGLEEMRSIKEDGEIVQVVIGETKEKVDETIDKAIDEIRTPFFPMLFESLKEGVIWLCVGIVGGVLLTYRL